MAGTACAAPVDLTITAEAKRAVMSFLVGTYGSECARGRGQAMPVPRSGSPIGFAADGTITWAGNSFNVTRLYINEMGVTRFGGSFASKIDIEEFGKGQRIAVAGVTQTAGQPAGATITVGDDSTTAPFGLCQGGPPPGTSTSLWPTAVRLLGTPSRTASCMDMKSSVQSRAPVAFDGRQLVIGPHRYAPGAAANEESLSVNDGNGDIGYSFGAGGSGGAGGELVIVSRHAGDKGLHFQVTPVNEPMAIFACDIE
ncbi:hypothetical protein [Piscinibacter terrae]|nr:hypothetical protein [Albitalea terrae]